MRPRLLFAVLAAALSVQAGLPGPALKPEERAKLEAARASLRAAVKAKADDADSWRRLGGVSQALGEAEAARDAFLQVTLLFPDDAGAWSLLAVAHEKLKELPQAIAAWEACLARAKDPALAAVARKHLLHLKP